MARPFSTIIVSLIFMFGLAIAQDIIRGEKQREGPASAVESAAAQTTSSILGKDLAESRGMILLDAVTYDIVVDHLEGCNIMVGFFNKRDLRKGTSSPEFTSRKAYLDFVIEAYSQPNVDLSNMIFAQVIVNGGENKMLAERNEISTFPSYIFISHTNKTRIIHMPYRVEDHRTSAFMSFISYFGNYDLMPPGLIRDFEVLAKQFVVAVDSDDKEGILNAAKDLLEKHGDETTLADAEYYVQVMSDLIDLGEDVEAHVRHEGLQQLGRARDEDLSASARAVAERRLNILRSFRAPRKPQRVSDSSEL